MPRITIQMFEGRTQEQKRALMAGVTKVICETCDARPDAVTIYIEEMSKSNYSKGGLIFTEYEANRKDKVADQHD